MILLTPVESESIVLDKGIFISTEMGKAISNGLKTGTLSFDEKLVPVHLPYDGLLKLDLGEHNHLKVNKELWQNNDLPAQYGGESLSGKKMIVFPMHGLGDQLYLAVAIRALAQKYPDMEVAVVKSSIASAEQWYPHIYFDAYYRMTGPVITIADMKSYDYYLNAEHFAHVDAYKGAYPPSFYLKYFFQHESMDESKPNSVPQIGALTPGKSPNSEKIYEEAEVMNNNGRPVVFLSSVSTGRVRDLPLKSVLRFIECVNDRYAVWVSSFKRPDIYDAVRALNLPYIKTTDHLITHVNDLIEIIRCADVVITSDSGITHLAEALKTPCGSVFNVVSPEERIGPYHFGESLMVEFFFEGVCKTPCYVHALKEGELCPGMKEANLRTGHQAYYDYPPCVDQLDGEHLVQLLEALEVKFHLLDPEI